MSILPTSREGQSPFLEGTCVMWAWDSTCLDALKRCPRKYQLSIIEGWRPKDESLHFTFGRWYTAALDHYHKTRAELGDHFQHEEVLRAVVDWALEESLGWNSGDTRKNRFSLIRTIVWYLDQYQNDPAVTLVDEEGAALSERSFRMELDVGPEAANECIDPSTDEWDTKQPYVLCGHLDRVVSYLGGNYVMDHKTTKSPLGDRYFDQYEPNNQMSLYTIAGQVIFDTPIRGVIIDAAFIPIDPPRDPSKFRPFARAMTYRTPAQTEEWLTDIQYWLARAEEYAIGEYWPMNDTACFNCPFNQHEAKVCAKDPAVRASMLEASFTKEDPWNPLRIRE